MSLVIVGDEGGVYDRAEYVIHAKLRNNLLLSRILESFPNVSQFCKHHNLNEAIVGQLVNMKRAAVIEDYRGARWTKSASAVADALGFHPEELFSQEQRALQLKTNEAFIQLSREQAMAAIDGGMEIALENRDLVNKLIDAARLTSRERKVVEMRFAGEMSLDDVAEALDVTRERVRQLELKAMRRLREASMSLEQPADLA